MSRDVPRMALIGCGAIAESFHVPALESHSALRGRVIPVDPNIDRAERMARRLGAHRVASDYREVLESVDGVIVATPHSQHVPIALECLRQKIHVLCEKPVAETPEQVNSLMAMATASGVTLSVNNTMRLFPAFQTTKRLIADGALGQLTNMELVFGEVFDWPAVTGHQFGRSSAGRGVFFDVGAHIVDLACWWLGAKPDVVSYIDDSRGGSEAVANLEFVSGTCRGVIRLSWLSRLGNTFRIVGETATLEGAMYDWEGVWLTRRGRRRTRVTAGRRRVDYAGLLLDNFIAVIQGKAAPLIPVEEVAPSIAVIAESYARRTRFEMPWHMPSSFTLQ